MISPRRDARTGSPRCVDAIAYRYGAPAASRRLGDDLRVVSMVPVGVASEVASRRCHGLRLTSRALQGNRHQERRIFRAIIVRMEARKRFEAPRRCAVIAALDQPYAFDE